MIRSLLPGIIALATAALPALAQPTVEQAELLRTARQHIEAGRPTEAIESLEPLTEAQPTLAEAHRLLGHAYQRANQPRRARDAFIASIAHGRLTADTIAALARLDRQAGRARAAATALHWLTLLEPDEPRYALLQAQLMLDTGALETARTLAHAAAKQRPDAHPALKMLGNVQLRQGETADAAATLATAYWLGPPDPRLARTIAELHFQRQHHDRAATWYRRATDGASTETASRLRLAELLIAAEHYDEATGLLRELAKVDGIDTVDVYRWLGHAEQQRGNHDAAAQAWRRGIELGLRDPQILQAVTSHALDHDRSAALRALLPLLADQGTPTRAMTQLLVRGNLRVDRPDAAIAAIERYVARAGLDPLARQLLDTTTP